MINAIPKRLMVVAGVALLLVLVVYLADKNGYTRAVADYSVEAALLADESKKKQAIEQIAVNDLADQFYKAQENEREKSIEVDALKRALRECDSRASGLSLPSSSSLHFFFICPASQSAAGLTYLPQH